MADSKSEIAKLLKATPLDKGGSIKREDLSQLLKIVVKETVTEAEVQRALDICDPKNTGSVPIEDFLTWVYGQGGSLKECIVNAIAGDTAGRLTASPEHPGNNIILMTDGYKFSHHKQFPVSWLPPQARPTGSGDPPILFAASGGGAAAKILSLQPVPRLPGDAKSPYKLTIVTNVATAVQVIEIAAAGDAADFTYAGAPLDYAGATKAEIVVELGAAQAEALKLPATHTKIKFPNVDESKLKRGSNLNFNFEGGSNVSYFTPRSYSHVFSHLTGENIVFFGLQYFVKSYLAGEVITMDKIDEAGAFIARYMADVRVAGPGVDHTVGYDYTMFPRGDWEAMVSGDYDATGKNVPALKGKLPIRIEALPEGTLLSPGVCAFKITNTHPRFYWLPNFLETLLVQVWYPMSVATQAREFKKTIQSYSILSQRVSQMCAILPGPGEFTPANIAEDNLAIHIAQVFDLLDFGYRGVSSHETAGLGAASYYTAGLEGSDTVAGGRLLLRYYNSGDNFTTKFEAFHGATSVPAAEHSTITSWADVSPDANFETYEAAEYNAFRNMIKQYMPSFAVSLVSDGFNVWHAVTRLWPSSLVPPDGGASMRDMLTQRLNAQQLTLIRPDSGEGVETLPHLLTLLNLVLPEHWDNDLAVLAPVFPEGDPATAKYNDVVARIRAKVGTEGNPFRRFKGQQMRVLQGDGVALDTVGDMLASILSNGFCANTVHFGSGGGLLQKLNRDSLAFAFKCCAMYVGDKCYAVGKDPIAGGKKSYGGNPAVVRNAAGVLENRPTPMSYEEWSGSGVAGDQLQKVFESGEVLIEQSFSDVTDRAKITAQTLDAAVRLALDNVDKKMKFFQKMSTDEAITVRLSEAACGSKWGQAHGTCLAELKEKYPQFNATFDKLGVTAEMTSLDIVNHIKANHVCEKAIAKKVLSAIADGDVEGAISLMGDKSTVTL